MKINLTSVKAFDRFFAKLGIAQYGIDKARKDVQEADKFGHFDNKMQKSRILSRIKSLEGNK